MESWTKILWAIPILLMIILLWPQARHWMKNSPKGSSKDWQSVILPLVGVMLFVIFLVFLVRGF